MVVGRRSEGGEGDEGGDDVGGGSRKRLFGLLSDQAREGSFYADGRKKSPLILENHLSSLPLLELKHAATRTRTERVTPARVQFRFITSLLLPPSFQLSPTPKSEEPKGRKHRNKNGRKAKEKGTLSPAKSNQEGKKRSESQKATADESEILRPLPTSSASPPVS